MDYKNISKITSLDQKLKEDEEEDGVVLGSHLC